MIHMNGYCYVVYSLHCELMNITDGETNCGNQWTIDNAYNIWTNKGFLIVCFVKELGAVANIFGTDMRSPLCNCMQITYYGYIVQVGGRHYNMFHYNNATSPRPSATVRYYPCLSHSLQFIDHNIMYAVMDQWDGWQILTTNLYTHLTILWYSVVGCSLPENTTKYLWTVGIYQTCRSFEHCWMGL